ncbi:hypothetical protein C8R44DRAFT_770471, partial [Mycena epipterygia]
MPAKINNVQTSARLAIMSDHDASEASRDILLVQPANVTTGTEEAPLVLPPSITEFVADAV